MRIHLLLIAVCMFVLGGCTEAAKSSIEHRVANEIIATRIARNMDPVIPHPK